MTIIRELSDIHLEFIRNPDELIRRTDLLIPQLPTDSETVLIIAGDIGTAVRITLLKNFLGILCARFKHVIYVLGNHEHYGFDISVTERYLVNELQFDNLTIAGNSVKSLVVDGVTFYATTLWTDYAKSPEEMKSVAKAAMNDHHHIFDGLECFSPDKAQLLHEQAKQQLGEFLDGKDNSKTVVISHHLPTYKAVHPRYGSGLLNGAFASDMDDFILKHQPAYWFFGHTHDAYNGVIGNTLLVCNPVGYPNEQLKNNGFHPSNIFTI